MDAGILMQHACSGLSLQAAGFLSGMGLGMVADQLKEQRW
jgi:hypothetical protein